MLPLLLLQHRSCLPLATSAVLHSRVSHLHFLAISLQRRAPPAHSSAQLRNDTTHELVVEKKTKGQKKREASRGVDWALQLSAFTTSQLRQAVRWGDLQEEVFDAVTLLKRIGRDGKNARRRQLNLIGGMLRSADPDLMEAVIKATKDGDVHGLFSKSTESVDSLNDEETVKEGHIKDMVDRWFQGLLSGDSDVSAEVYSIRSLDFNRQELRRLVKDASQTEHTTVMEKESDADSEAASAETAPLSVEILDQRRKMLRKFLEDLIGKVSEIDS